MEIDELIKKRLLRKIKPDLEKARASIRIAEAKLKKAEELSNYNFFNEAILNAYTSLFHACRALLYNDGIQEKSHYGTYIYIKEKYEKLLSKELIQSFYHYQLNRHAVLYGIDETTLSKDESEDAIHTAHSFVIKIKKFLHI